MKNIPDPTAVTDVFSGSYGDANSNSNNAGLVGMENEHITLATFQRTSLKAYPLKCEVPYKQYQTCVFQNYENPWETLVDNRTVVNLRPKPSDLTQNSPFMIYYLGEVNQVKKIDNWLYNQIKN